MPRIKNKTDALLADLMTRLTRLVEVAQKEGRTDALEEVRALTAGAAPATRQRAPTKKAKKRTTSGMPRKNPWAGLTDKERLKRINAIRKGRGLPLKRKL